MPDTDTLARPIDWNGHLVADPPEYAQTDPEDLYAEVCEQPGCTHDRGSHWDGTGSCGWCPCGQFRTPDAFAALVAAYLPDDQPVY